MKIFFIYLLIINVIGCSAMFMDKRRARVHKWRISEKTLFLLAFMGGSLGTTLGMNMFRHKTRHWYFKFGMPLIFLVQLGAVIYLNNRFF